jgi:hypothetical protein
VKRRKTGRASALSQAAALLGRIGGKIGGPARAAGLTAARCRAIAKAAAAARWNKEQHA